MTINPKSNYSMNKNQQFHLLATVWLTSVCTALAQGNGFTYQGRMNDGANPVNGSYDLTFTLFSVSSGPGQLGSTQTNLATGVSNGLFTVALDFGANFPGADRWLEITARTNGGGTFTTLAPRQKLTPTPYAIYSGTAATAASAANLSGTLPASQLTGTVPLAQLPGAVVTNNASGVALNGTFTGNGAGVTNVQLTTLSTFGAVTWPGNFAPGATLAVGGAPRSVVAADVNGDGWLDLISGNTSSNLLTVLTNNRTGGFGQAAALPVGNFPWTLTAADVNGDGKVDLISANYGTNTLTVLTNNGSGGFVLASSPIIGNKPISVVAVDVNGDGWLDLVAANDLPTTGPGTVTVLTNSGSGRFGSNATYTVALAPKSVAAADVNGDGKADLCVANYHSDSISVLTNNGSGSFAPASTNSLGLGVPPSQVVATDVNGDGKLDLVAASYYDSSLSVLTNKGGGSFGIAYKTAYGIVGFGPWSLATADVNGDGRSDFITANYWDNTLSVLTNDSSGGLALAAVLGVGSGPFGVTAADLSGDGKADLVSANSGDNTLTVLFNTPVFTGGGAGLTSLNPGSLTSGTVTSALDFSNAANSFTGNGAGLTSLNASNLASGTVPAAALGNAWQTAGNAGANPMNGAFLGTTDNLPLELKVNGRRALRLEPTASNDTVNVVGGSPFNAIAPGVLGGAISGGGSTNYILLDAGGLVGYIYNASNHVGADFSFIGGGALNRIEAYSQATTNSQGSTIAGGFRNTIQTDAALATIGGGFANMVRTNAKSSAIGGGVANSTGGRFSTVPGGYGNSALGYASFAAGYSAQAKHDGAFVWADRTGAEFGSTAGNQFLIRATGGVGIGTTSPGKTLQVGDVGVFGSEGMIRLGSRSTNTASSTGRKWDIGVPQTGDDVSGPGYSFVIRDADNLGANAPFIVRYDNHYVGIGTNNPQQALHVVGNILASGTVTGSSDRNAKEHFAAVSPRAVLDQVAALPITRWNYKAEAGVTHVGPMAQDFYSAFNVGQDDTHISMVDADGVALAAIQGLNEKLEQKLEQKETEITELKQRLEKLEHLMTQNNGGAK